MEENKLLPCPRCGKLSEDLTKNGWHRCVNNHLWRDEELITRDEVCEAALDVHIDGLSMGEIWAFREAWRTAAEYYTRAQQDPDPDLVERAREWLRQRGANDDGKTKRVDIVEMLASFARSANDEKLERIEKDLNKWLRDYSAEFHSKNGMMQDIARLLDREFPE